MSVDLSVETVPISEITPDPGNARRHPERNMDALRASLARFGQRKPIILHGTTVIAGNGTLQAARDLGWQEIAVTRVPDSWTDAEAKAYAIADNRTGELAEWDPGILSDTLHELADDGWEMPDLGFAPIQELDDGDWSNPPGGDAGDRPAPVVLADRYLIPPLSLLDQRSGPWQARRRAWLALGIRSEEGRDGNLLGMSDTILTAGKGLTMPSASGRVPSYYAQKNAAEAALGRPLTNEEFERDHLKVTGEPGISTSGTSVFDPVLCEIAYRWFTRPGAAILDPFAGGSVRGITAAALGRHYTGLELRPEQVTANEAQAAEIIPGLAERTLLPGPHPAPTWICGDSNITLDEIPDDTADLIFSCPPYADLEQYSDDPADLSNMPYDQFLTLYRSIIAKAVAKLRQDRFAFWVVGEIRDKKGNYRGFIPDTIQAFTDAGAAFYNEGILIQPVGTLAIRADRMFSSTRKMGKTHQQALVFIKGSAKKATTWCGPVETAPIQDEPT